MQLSWFYNKGLSQGIFWGILIYLVSSLNDVLMRFLGNRLHFIEIAFFRFLFSTTIILVPILLSKDNLFRTNLQKMHFIRGILGCIALCLCCFSVIKMQLAENTIILFSEALFVLPLSHILLKEHLNTKAIVATIIGFCGLIIMFKPKASNIDLFAIVPTIAAFLFAIMDIIIKKMIDKNENQLTMLFYFGLYTTIFAGIFVPFVWQKPSMKEIILIFLLGIGANLIQVFIFLAYRATKASNLSPIRYTELPFAILFGYLFFNQIPDFYSIIGAFLIIISSLIISWAK